MPTELGINERNVNAKMRIEGEPADGWFTPTVDQKFRLGTRGEDDEGNVYYYAENGAVALTTGNLIATAILNGATTTAQEDLVVGTSSAIGDKFGYATILTTAQTTVDLFVDGTYSVAAGTAAQGRGSIYKIKSHPNPLTVASHRFEFYRPCRTIITAGTAVVRLAVNPYKHVIQAPVTTPTGMALGICPCEVPIGYYFWLQTAGIANALSAGAMTYGTSVVRAVAVAGAVGPQVAGASSVITEVLGYALAAIDDTDNGPIMLNIRS